LGLSPFSPNAPRPLDRPFVPHNLMPSYGSPVPLLKFQMTPRLRHSLHPQGPRKGAQICMSEWSQFRTHTKCRLGFLPLLHISYMGLFISWIK